MDFVAWPKIPRLKKDMIVTEKIDGTNGAIIIEQFGNDMNHPDLFERYSDPGEPGLTTMTNLANERYQAALVGLDTDLYLVGAQSRKRLIHPKSDNFGFARWVFENAEDLVHALGVGRHYGEWWGSGIQRGYGLTKGEKRFSLFNVSRYAGINGVFSELDVVPTLYTGPFSIDSINDCLANLQIHGSHAAPGFMNPEGVVIYHVGAGTTFKAFVDPDDEAAPKSVTHTKADYKLVAPKGAGA